MKWTRIFAPGVNTAGVNLGLLVLRLWLGITLLANHGWNKLTTFGDKASAFPDFFGIGSAPTLALAIFGEVVCAALLAIGCVTRFAALSLTILMSVAFLLAHKAALSGPQSGELAFIYLAGFVALLLTGPGRYSVDAALFGKKSG